MISPFLTVARQGKNSWKRYLAGVGTILTISFGVIAIPVLIISAISGIPVGDADVFLYSRPVFTINLSITLFTMMIISIYIVIKRFHQRHFLTLFGPSQAIDWLRIIKAYSLWLGLYGVSFLVWYLVNPSRYLLTFNFSEWLPLALLNMVLSSIYAFATVLFFYAYLLQGVGLLVRHPFPLVGGWGLIIGTLSIAPELGPYAWVNSVLYSTFITWIVIKDRRPELAIGLVAANVLPSFIFVDFVDAQFPLPTIFKVANMAPPLPLLFTFIFRMGLFYLICFGLRRRSASPLP
jgi:uncharacterized protein